MVAGALRGLAGWGEVLTLSFSASLMHVWNAPICSALRISKSSSLAILDVMSGDVKSSFLKLLKITYFFIKKSIKRVTKST